MSARSGYAQPLPRGVMASAVVGITAGAAAWLMAGVWSSFTSSYVRLDQVSALSLGAATGAAVLGAREFRQRRNTVYGAVAGALLGGTGALAGVSVLAFGRWVVTPRVFVIERVTAWALASLLTVLALEVFVGPGRRRIVTEAGLIAVVGGATAGVLFTLPGATDLWQSVAFLWFGATVGAAISGPESWSATAVVESLPPRGRQLSLLALHESLLYDGTLSLGEAQVAVVPGGVALYPPAGGIVADGRHVRRPRFLDHTTDITIGRTRYRIRVLAAPR